MKEKSNTVIERFGFKDEDLTTPEHDKVFMFLLNRENMIKVIKDFSNGNLKDATIHRMVIEGEHAIVGYNKYNIGFVDIHVVVEFYLCNNGERRVLNSRELGIEIKPYIKSIGELLRQINMYRSHVDWTAWAIATYSIEYKDVLSGQGIHIIDLNKFDNLQSYEDVC